MRSVKANTQKRLELIMRNGPISFALTTVMLVFTNSIVQSGDVTHRVVQDAGTDSGPRPPSGSSQRGEELYKASCTVCHGRRGEGSVGPKLAGNPLLSNDQAFWKVVHEGRHVMPPLKGVVTDEQLTDIRAWLRTLP